MTPNRPLPILLAGLLLAVPPAFAEEYRHPSGFEPKPVFEDEAPARKPFPAKPAPAPKAAPATAQTPKTAEESHPPGPPPSAPARVVDSAPAPSVQNAPPASTEPAPAVRGSESLSGLFMENYPAWLIVLALGGFVVWTQRESRMAADSRRPVAGNGRAEPGRTGVARYLERMAAADEPRRPG